MRLGVLTGMRLASVMAVLAFGTLALGEMPAGERPTTQPKNETFDAIKGLEGTWVGMKVREGENEVRTIIFKTMSGGSAVQESMFPGTPEEMVNMYTQEGANVVMTHYCGMGNQPRMKAAGIKDGVIKLEYVDGGNLKSRDDGHMDSLEITIKGDTLTEKWTMYAKGKTVGEVVFEYRKKA